MIDVSHLRLVTSHDTQEIETEVKNVCFIAIPTVVDLMQLF